MRVTRRCCAPLIRARHRSSGPRDSAFRHGFALSEPRATCQNCQRAQAICICSSLPAAKLLTKTTICVLQHAHEAHRKKAIGTVPIMKLCLSNVDVIVHSRRLQEEIDSRLSALVQQPGTLLLYPGADAVPIARFALSEEPSADCGPKTLLVLDGTWPQARQLIRLQPQLAQMQRVTLPTGDNGQPSLYGEIRRLHESKHVPGYISTLEAVGHALELLEPGDANAGTFANGVLRRAMASMVEKQRVYRSTGIARLQATGERGAWARRESLII